VLVAATAGLVEAQNALAEAPPGMIEVPDEYLQLNFQNPAILGFSIIFVVWAGPQSIGMVAIDNKVDAAMDKCEEYGIDTSDCFKNGEPTPSLLYGRLRCKLMEYESRELCAKNNVDISDITEESEEKPQARVNEIKSRLSAAGIEYKFKLEGFL